MNSDTYTENAEMFATWAKMSADIGSKALSVLYYEEDPLKTSHVMVTRSVDLDSNEAVFTFDAMEGFPQDAVQYVPDGWRGRLIRWLARPPKPAEERPYQARRDPEDVW